VLYWDVFFDNLARYFLIVGIFILIVLHIDILVLFRKIISWVLPYALLLKWFQLLSYIHGDLLRILELIIVFNVKHCGSFYLWKHLYDFSFCIISLVFRWIDNLNPTLSWLESCVSVLVASPILSLTLINNLHLMRVSYDIIRYFFLEILNNLLILFNHFLSSVLIIFLLNPSKFLFYIKFKFSIELLIRLFYS